MHFFMQLSEWTCLLWQTCTAGQEPPFVNSQVIVFLEFFFSFHGLDPHKISQLSDNFRFSIFCGWANSMGYRNGTLSGFADLTDFFLMLQFCRTQLSFVLLLTQQNHVLKKRVCIIPEHRFPVSLQHLVMIYICCRICWHYYLVLLWNSACHFLSRASVTNWLDLGVVGSRLLQGAMQVQAGNWKSQSHWRILSHCWSHLILMEMWWRCQT